MQRAIILIFFLSGCSQLNLPKLEPVSAEEEVTFQCNDIQREIIHAEQALEVINSDSTKNASAAAVGLGMLGIIAGSFSTDMISIPVEIASATGRAQDRLVQLRSLAEKNSCYSSQEILDPDPNDN